MEISRRTDYACRIIRAAYRHADECVSISVIAEEEHIPYAFARAIQHELTQAGFVTTTRGAKGGLVLNCDLAQTSMLDLMRALNAKNFIAPCTNDPEFCDQSTSCVYHRVFRGADRLISSYFASIMLADLFEQGQQHPSVNAALKLSETFEDEADDTLLDEMPFCVRCTCCSQT